MPATQTSKIILTAVNKTDAAFKKAQGNFSALGSIAKVSLGAVGAAAIGAGVAMAALGANSLDNIDTMAKVADKVGLSTERLAEFRFAADEAAGVASGTFDMAMQRFARRVGEAAQGTGELLPILEQYNIAVRNADGSTRSTEEVFRDYADAVANAGSEQEQLRLSFKGFDSEGAALVNMLREGSGALEGYGKTARDLGLVVSRFDAAKIEMANDSMGRLGKAFEGIGNKIAVQAAPYLKVFSDLLVDGLTKSGWLTKSIEWLGVHTIDAVAAIADAWLGLKKIWQVVELGFGSLIQVTLAGLVKLEDAVIAAAEWIPGLEPPERGPIREWAEAWSQSMSAIREDLVDFSLPGDKIRASYDATLAEIDRVAAEVASRPSIVEQAVVPTDTATAKATEKARESALSMLDGIYQANLAANDNEEGLIQYRLDRQIAAIDAAQLNEMEAIEARRMATETAEAELADIRRSWQDVMIADVAAGLDRQMQAEARAAEQNKQIWASGMKGKAQIMGSVLGQVSALMETGSKKMFAVGKAAAIGETVIQTYKAAQGAYASLASIPYVGPFLGAAAAAAAIASGMARVSAIKSQSFGGSGSASAGGGGGVSSGGGGGFGGAADVPAMAPPANDRGPGRVVYINVPNDTGMVSMDWVVNQLGPKMAEAAGDGVDFKFSGAA